MAPVARFGRAASLVLCLAACNRQADPQPAPPTTVGVPTSVPAPSTTRLPTLASDPLPGLEAAALHGALAKLGFTPSSPPPGTPGFVTTTSVRSDATVSTYGKGPSDVVKVVAEANAAVAQEVFVRVISVTLRGADARKAETWVKAELRKGPTSPTQPRSSSATYAGQPFDLLVTTSNATLGIGRTTAR